MTITAGREDKAAHVTFLVRRERGQEGRNGEERVAEGTDDRGQ